jgi:hypothetical protein
MDKIHQYTYCIFGATGLIMAAFVIIFVPETMGRSLEQMDELFGMKDPKTPPIEVTARGDEKKV